jgi:hypothetical protein
MEGVAQIYLQGPYLSQSILSLSHSILYSSVQSTVQSTVQSSRSLQP